MWISIRYCMCIKCMTRTHISKWCVEVNNIYFFLSTTASASCYSQNTATMIPLDTCHMPHSRLNNHRIYTQNVDNSRKTMKEQFKNTIWLTVITLMPHNLAVPVGETNSQAGAVWLQIALCARVPVNTCYTEGACYICQTTHGHLHLSTFTETNRKEVFYLYCSTWHKSENQ